MNDEKIIELAAQFDDDSPEFAMSTEAVIAFARDMYQLGQKAEREKYQELIEKAEAVIARWKTPSWKEAEPTAETIYQLRDVVERVKEVEE